MPLIIEKKISEFDGQISRRLLRTNLLDGEICEIPNHLIAVIYGHDNRNPLPRIEIENVICPQAADCPLKCRLKQPCPIESLDGNLEKPTMISVG